MSEDKDNQPVLPFELSEILNIGDLKENDVVIFKAENLDDSQKLLGSIFGRYRDELRKKNVSVMLIKNTDSIEVLNEEHMNAAGWHKKGLIIH